MSCRDFLCSSVICPHSNTWGRESWLHCADPSWGDLANLLRITTNRWQTKDSNTELSEFTQDWMPPVMPTLYAIRLRMWIFHFSCGIHIWLREDRLPPPCLPLHMAASCGSRPPGVEVEQSQDCTSKTSREVCTASSWLWYQLHAFGAVWN